MRERVSLVLPLFNQLALTRRCLDSLAATIEPFRLVVIDNGSTDGTRELFRAFPYPYPLRFIENDDNSSVIASLNRAWPAVETELLCFLHNDTEVVDPAWLTKLVREFDDPTIGITGLFGVKRMRRNSRFVGRTIVHSLAEGPTVRPPGEDVVAMDGVCLCMRRRVLEEIGGLDESYGFYHGWDKDISFAVRDVAPRRVAIDRLLEKWGHRLPADARPLGARAREWVRARLGAREVVYPWRP